MSLQSDIERAMRYSPSEKDMMRAVQALRAKQQKEIADLNEKHRKEMLDLVNKHS